MSTPAAPRTRIRRARETDLPALSNLLDSLFSVESDFEPDRARQRRGVSALLGAGDRAAVFVAEARGEVIGMCTLQVLISTAEGGEVGLVEDVVVAPAWRGNGVGSALLQAAEEWAGERRLSRLQLLVDMDNEPALHFYESKGWETTRLAARRRRLG